jgi:hypothetical protein
MSPASYLTAPPRVAGRIIAWLAEAHLSPTGTCETKLTQPRFRIEAPIDHQDVTTIRRLLGDTQHDLARILELLDDS